MIDKTLYLLRATVLSLAVVFALSPPAACADTALVQDMATQLPSTIASDAKSAIVLAQQVLAKGKPAVKAPDGAEERAKVRAFIDEKTKWIKEQPVIQTFLSVLPALWTPFKVAALLLFLVGYVAFHYKRRGRNQAEAEQNSQPSAHEAEFGITAEFQSREVQP
jgi:hypothetical protein